MEIDTLVEHDDPQLQDLRRDINFFLSVAAISGKSSFEYSMLSWEKKYRDQIVIELEEAGYTVKLEGSVLYVTREKDDK